MTSTLTPGTVVAPAPAPSVGGEAAAVRLPALTGLRFIAAFLVFLFHACLLFVFADPAWSQGFLGVAGNAGPLGVSFFFMLSGFVLTWSARPGDTTGKFWRRRFFKIAPNHLVTFAVALAVLAMAGNSSKLGPTIANLFLVQSWVPDLEYVGSVNDVTWSLSVEALFYLSFPLWYYLISRVKANALWAVAGGLALISLLLPVISYSFLPDQPRIPWGPGSYVQIWFVYQFPLARLSEFLLGVVMARIVLSGKWIRVPVLVATLLTIVGYVASLNVPFLFGYAASTVIPLALLIPAVATIDIQGRKSWLNSKVFVWLGEISFAFFLLHHLVLQYGHLSLGPVHTPFGVSGPPLSPVAGIGFLLACAAFTLLLAWALFAGVERPIMARFARSRK